MVRRVTHFGCVWPGKPPDWFYWAGVYFNTRLRKILGLNHNKAPMSVRVLSAVVLFVLGLGLGLSGVHWLPGFHNLRVFNSVHISSNGIPVN